MILLDKMSRDGILHKTLSISISIKVIEANIFEEIYKRVFSAKNSTQVGDF